MIFITLGSQKFQFNRLLKEIDYLVDIGYLNEKIFAQTGYSDYIPQNYEYKSFLDRNEFNDVMDNCDKVITHGGTGAIIGAIKKGKKVIAIPRLKKYGEHVDDHQVQITDEFSKMNLILGIENISQLGDAISNLNFAKTSEYKSNTQNIINDINTFING